MNLFQQITLSILVLLGFWKLGELAYFHLILPLDRWQENRQVGRAKRAKWKEEED